MMMPRLQKWGSFFLPRKQNLSLSLSLEHKTPNRAYARRTSLFRFTRMKKPLSDLSLLLLLLLLRKSAFERAQVLLLLSFVRIRCFSLFRLLGKMKLSVRAFSSSFFILSFSLRVLVLEALFLHQLWLNECFFQNERTKKSIDTQHPLLSLTVFVGKLSSFDSFYSTTQ